MLGIDKKYVRYECAGDQFIGRILAMLDLSSPRFATLAPHFDIVDEPVLDAVKGCFPNAHGQLQSVLVNCLASLVFHGDYFQRVLPSDHALLKTAVFAQGFVARLRNRVGLSFVGDKVAATGIPPHISITRKLDEVESLIENLPSKISAAVHAEFENRAIDAGQLTRENIQSMLGGMLEEVKSMFTARQPSTEPLQAPSLAHGGGPRTWLVEGSIRRVPADFEFDTKLPSQVMFQLYCLGDQIQHIGPFRKLESMDFVTNKQRKRLSDMQALLRPVEAGLKKSKHWKDTPTLDEVNHMWEQGSSAVVVDYKTSAGRKRRLKELAWTTHLNEYRKKGRVQVD
jgi:hypothetical protein